MGNQLAATLCANSVFAKVLMHWNTNMSFIIASIRGRERNISSRRVRACNSFGNASRNERKSLLGYVQKAGNVTRRLITTEQHAHSRYDICICNIYDGQIMNMRDCVNCRGSGFHGEGEEGEDFNDIRKFRNIATRCSSYSSWFFFLFNIQHIRIYSVAIMHYCHRDTTCDVIICICLWKILWDLYKAKVYSLTKLVYLTTAGEHFKRKIIIWLSDQDEYFIDLEGNLFFIYT